MVVISRFFEGFLGIAPMIVAGGALYDVWYKRSGAVAVLVFLACNFVGLTAGPILGACIISSSAEWQWVEWTTMLLALAVFILALLFVAETYHLVIFQNRARDLRFLHRDWTYHAELDEERSGWREVSSKHLLRPLVMLISEVPLSTISLYLMFVYGLLFLFCESYPIVFMETHGWQQPVATLPFLVVAFGICLAAAILLAWDYYYPSSGSQRLVQMICGGATLTTGLFWFAATSDPKFHWLPQACAGVFIGSGIFMVFLSGLSFILNHYSKYANSAVAATNATRNLAAAIASMVGKSAYRGLGVSWASAAFGFISMALVVIPILLLRRERKKELLVTDSEGVPTEGRTYVSALPQLRSST
ncbi:hypothetical protein ZTR_09239 [Talaromyces verruculosus]|nr:hypothetical protein ZTR_09239 [Talaromyces verruculosus]